MNSNKRINLLVDLVKLALIILIACVLVSVIVFIVSDDPWTAISSFFLGPFTSLRRVGNIIEAASPLIRPVFHDCRRFLLYRNNRRHGGGHCL